VAVGLLAGGGWFIGWRRLAYWLAAVSLLAGGGWLIG